MSSPPAGDRPLYGIDAGGSGTSVRAWDGDQWTSPALNPSSAGQDSTGRRLPELFARIRAHAERGRGRVTPVLWLASAAVDETTAEQETGRFLAAAREAGLCADLIVSNDLTPLLLHAPAGVGHVIAACGTGSGFLATDGGSPPVRVGGYEYLGSDEGSAFDLGLRGLRSSVRGLDGRGQDTVLADRLAAHAGVPVFDLARELAQLPFPKTRVAALAPLVLRAWLDGDPVATSLVGDIVSELVLGVRAARDAAALSPGWRLSVIGGVMTGCPDLFARLAGEAAGLSAGPVELIGDPAAVVLAALIQAAGLDLAGMPDPRISRGVWRVTTCQCQTERLSRGCSRM